MNNSEIDFLRDWLQNNEAVTCCWPGSVIKSRVEAALEDGVVTDAERQHLVDTLQQLVGGTLKQLAESTHVTQLIDYETPDIVFDGATFCLTGDFVYAPRAICARHTEEKGGLVKGSVSKALNYLVVGGLGSPEWKHGSFGTKIEAAMKLKPMTPNLKIIHEDHWSVALVNNS
ncbi:MAG: BRCT domain-containing protein [Lysobacterales bacterium]